MSEEGTDTVQSKHEQREYVRDTTQQTPRSVEKEGDEALQALEPRFPCSLWEGLLLGKLEGGLLPWDGPHAEAEECDELFPWEEDEMFPSLEKEGAAEKMSNETAKLQIPHPPVSLAGEEIEKIGSEDVEEGRGGGKVF